jgi:hypothetical protein
MCGRRWTASCRSVQLTTSMPAMNSAVPVHGSLLSSVSVAAVPGRSSSRPNNRTPRPVISSSQPGNSRYMTASSSGFGRPSALINCRYFISVSLLAAFT